MVFFDLHCHPSFKSALGNFDVNNCKNPVDPVDIEGTGILGPCINVIAGNSLDSQSSFKQIPGGSLVVASFLAIERVYTFVTALKKLKPLDRKILDEIKNQYKSYYLHMKDRDLKHFLAYEKMSISGKRYQLIDSINNYPENPDENTIYVIGSIEGAHNFYDIENIIQQEEVKNQNTIIKVLKKWKQDSNSDPGNFPRLLYITLCHHAQNVLANHAWAIPIAFNPGPLPVGSFDPTGNGISPIGLEFIRTALYTDSNEKRIQIDIKHLSIKSRQDYYRLLDNEFNTNPGNPIIPILATHVGISGTSWDRPPLRFPPVSLASNPTKCLEVHYREIGGFLREVPPTGTQPYEQFALIPFNPWSINLYDEDIRAIMRSRGLIGISLDRRIIGSKLTNTYVEPERFSRMDIPSSWVNTPDSPFSLYPQKALPNLFSGNQSQAIQDQWTFAQQIVHIVLITELAKNENILPEDINPWDHICLGSDYDGLIHAIKTAETAQTLDRLFSNRLQKFIAEMINHLIQFGPLTNSTKVPKNIVQKLAIDNGKAFLKKHFV